VLADSAFGHAEVSPTSLRVGRAATLTFTVPCERDDATIARVQVLLPASLRRDSGETTWTGSEGKAVTVVLHVTPKEAGDIAIPVVQTYSDGEVVRWSGESSSTPAPLVHVSAAASANRDRLVILLLAAAIAVAAFALRRGRQRR
jgi:hypothetical protein